MLKFIARRLLVLLFVFFVLTVILFWMHIRLTEFEADRLVRDYFYFTSSIVRGNFGISTSSKLPVIYELKTYLPSTLELIFFSFILSFVAGTVAGIAAGLNHHSMLLKGTTTMLRLTTSFPVFWLGQMMITIFAVELKILPTAGNISLFCDVPQVTGSIFIDSILTMDPACIKSMLDHLVLPVIVLSFMPATQFFLLARRASFTISEMDFIRMAISRGQSQFSLARKHIFELDAVRLVIMIETVCIIFIILLTSYLGIKPIINAAERIKNDSPIPISGSNEFRYLARNYNKLYGAYRKSVAHLNYKASHDELTGAYNRTGYDLLFSSIDLKTTYMLLIDVDNFKDINDTYGHEAGDKVLKKIVAVLNKNFRSDDYVCRLGGDEFVVFMVHADEHLHELVASKICQINKQLADTSDSLPRTSVSIGVVHGTQVNNREDLYKYADESLYDIKRKGKNGYAFYEAKA